MHGQTSKRARNSFCAALKPWLEGDRAWAARRLARAFHYLQDHGDPTDQIHGKRRDHVRNLAYQILPEEDRPILNAHLWNVLLRQQQSLINKMNYDQMMNHLGSYAKTIGQTINQHYDRYRQGSPERDALVENELLKIIACIKACQDRLISLFALETLPQKNGQNYMCSALDPEQLCARDYPGSVARGRLRDGSINCECPEGHTWNSGRTACEKLIPPQQLCARDYPGSIAQGRTSNGSVNCVCPQGFDWNSSKTHCVESAGGMNSAECNRIVGRWRWFTGRDVDFFPNNSWKTTDGHSGSWQCKRDGSIVVIPDQGTWRDTVRVNQNGSSLSGRNEQGVSVTATRSSPARRQDCPSGYNPYGCN